MKKQTNTTTSNIEETDIIKKIQHFSKEYSYSVRDWDIMTIIRMFSWRKQDEVLQDYIENEDLEIYIPTYQRRFVWTDNEKSHFIESLFMNLPMPFIFLNQTSSEEDNMGIVGILEIIDGLQRLSTIKEFIDWDLKLRNLEYIKELNGYTYNQLPGLLQKRFKLISVRVLIFNWLDIDQRREMFFRINTTGNKLTPSEVRKGVYEWPVYKLFVQLSKSPLFERLCPLTPWRKNREEWVELILRYFAYTERYDEYNQKVKRFLDTYMNEKSKELEKDLEEEREQKLQQMKDSFMLMLDIVDSNLRYGFRKKEKWKRTFNKSFTSRVYFESISVWIGLALQKKPKSELKVDWLQNLLTSEDYEKIISSDGANNKKKFQERIEIVRDYLLS